MWKREPQQTDFAAYISYRSILYKGHDIVTLKTRFINAFVLT